DTSSDSGTSVRHHQVLDGCNTLSHETPAESGNRDGAQCARLQHEARDGDHRRGGAAGGPGSLSQGPTHSNRRQHTPQGASGALGEWIPGKFAFGDANAGGVLGAVPIRGLFHTAWAISRPQPEFISTSRGAPQMKFLTVRDRNRGLGDVEAELE